MLLSRRIALTSRSVLRLKGRDSLSLLQALVTPNVLKEKPSPTYGYALDVRGRILFDFFLHSLQGSENDDYALDLDSPATANAALKHLTNYRLRKKVQLSLEPSLGVFVSSDPQDSLHRDPRTELQLYRGLSEAQGCDEDVSEYNELRLEQGWAEGGSEMPPGTCFPLEYNGDILPGGVIAFDKGCYIGQELTARTHHTGVIRKRILPLTFSKEGIEVDFDAPIIDSKGKKVGKLRSGISPSGKAVGLLRVKDALESSEDLECGGLQCKTKVPSWWPELK